MHIKAPGLNRLFCLTILLMVWMPWLQQESYAQFNLNGQLMQRAELRNGFGAPSSHNADPAAFIAGRTRLQAAYQLSRFTMYASIQDVRTFGSVPQLKPNDPFLSVHEAWGEWSMNAHWSLKTGRQELNYDDARFLGNVDWSLQARSHDFVLVKFEKNNFRLHTGAGYNQDGEQVSGNIFSITGQYKTAQMIWGGYKAGKLEASFLFWNDGRQFILKDTAGNLQDKDTRFMQTWGLPALKYSVGNTTFSGFYYHQTGKDISGRTVNAFAASLQASQRIVVNERKSRQMKITGGIQTLSGTTAGQTHKNFSFSPLYGTNHAHNGYMDYFYVGGRHENSVGLHDVFLRLRMDVNKDLFLSVNGHYFTAYADVIAAGTKLDPCLGSELDCTFGYVIMPSLSVQAGYSQMFASTTLYTLRNVTAPGSIHNWTYLMLIFRPGSDKLFSGLLF